MEDAGLVVKTGTCKSPGSCGPRTKHPGYDEDTLEITGTASGAQRKNPCEARGNMEE